MNRLFDKTFWGLTIGLVGLLVLNFFLEEWMRTIGLQSLSRGCVAIGLLILWRAGLVSFGHALFFGLLSEKNGSVTQYLLISPPRFYFTTKMQGSQKSGL